MYRALYILYYIIRDLHLILILKKANLLSYGIIIIKTRLLGNGNWRVLSLRLISSVLKKIAWGCVNLVVNKNSPQ